MRSIWKREPYWTKLPTLDLTIYSCRDAARQVCLQQKLPVNPEVNLQDYVSGEKKIHVCTPACPFVWLPLTLIMWNRITIINQPWICFTAQLICVLCQTHVLQLCDNRCVFINFWLIFKYKVNFWQELRWIWSIPLLEYIYSTNITNFNNNNTLYLCSATHTLKGVLHRAQRINK